MVGSLTISPYMCKKKFNEKGHKARRQLSSPGEDFNTLPD